MSTQKSSPGKASDKLRWLGEASGWFAGGLTLVMMVAILREVVGRYFFNNPSNWSLELSGYLLVALAYLGAPYTEMMEGNIRIDFLYNRFSSRLRMVADIVIYLIGICWSAVVAWQGWLLAWESWQISARSSEAMAWPLFPSQVLVPIGSLLLCLVLACKISLRIRDLFSGEGR
jgi:TRAP-type C4-dicarboxylate transport system permease small subunit